MLAGEASARLATAAQSLTLRSSTMRAHNAHARRQPPSPSGANRSHGIILTPLRQCPATARTPHAGLQSLPSTHRRRR
eukprot:1966818-Prymnesium_polylepis.1